MISSKNVDFSKKNGKISTLDKVPLPPYAVLFLPCPLFPLTIHERVLLVLNEHFWNSACGEWLQGVDRDRRVRAVGLFNLNSNWRRKVVAVAVPLFLFASENKKFNLLLWFFMRRAPYAHPHSGCQKSLRKSLLPLGLHSRSSLFGTSGGKAVRTATWSRFSNKIGHVEYFIHDFPPSFCQCLIGIDWPFITRGD